jgi:hypothetical protein
MVSLIPVFCASTSAQKWPVEPSPHVPNCSGDALFFAKATSSFRLLAGKSFVATRMIGDVPAGDGRQDPDGS